MMRQKSSTSAGTQAFLKDEIVKAVFVLSGDASAFSIKSLSLT